MVFIFHYIYDWTKGFRFIGEPYIGSGIVSAAFDTRVYIFPTFHTEEPNEREKIAGCTQCRSLLFLLSSSMQKPVPTSWNSVLDLFSVETIESTPLRFSPIPSTALTSCEFATGRKGAGANDGDLASGTGNRKPVAIASGKHRQSVRLAKVNS